MNSSTNLIYFIKGKNLTEQDYLNLSRYNSVNISVIRYSKKKETLKIENKSEKFKEKNIFYIFRMSEDSSDVIEYVIDRLLHEVDTNISVDVSNASPYHSSALTALGMRWGFEVYCQYDETKNLMSDRGLSYEITSNDERRILEAITLEPQSFADIVTFGEINGTICRSNIYKLLSRMCERGLLTLTKANIDEDHKGKMIRGYKFTPEQYLDYKGFIKQQMAIENKLGSIERKKQKNKENRNSLV